MLCDTLAGLTLLRDSDVAGIVPEVLLRGPEGRGMVAVDLDVLDPGVSRVVQLTRTDAPLTPAATYFAQCLRDACQA